MMLAGIKRGTKKRKPESNVSDKDGEAKVARSVSGAVSNSTVADELRLALQSGGQFSPTTSRDIPTNAGESIAASYERNYASASYRTPSAANSPTRLEHTDAADPSVADMVRLEKQQSSMSHAQQEMRTIVRRNKRQSRVKGAVDSDEEEERQRANLMPSRKRSAGLTVPDRTTTHLPTSITDSSWWWYESSRFDKRRMLALGRYVTLSVAATSRSLIPGAHFFLVPIPHATAWTHCEDDTVWTELRKFQTSLREWARSVDKGVLFWETVLVNQGAKQTRLEAIFLPSDVCQDAPLYFRSALTEIAEEWGTHQSIIPTKYFTKELRKSIPKNFSYFYVEYGNNDDGAGHAQMIESKSFPQDFGIDTVAGMMRLDPLRFRSNQDKNADDGKMLQDVTKQWKRFDWTTELHGKME